MALGYWRGALPVSVAHCVMIGALALGSVHAQGLEAQGVDCTKVGVIQRPPAAIPSSPPDPQPYERIQVVESRAYVGVGHLTSVHAYGWGWQDNVQFPLFATPDGKEKGWIANGWLLVHGASEGVVPLGTTGMIETGYEMPTFIVLEARSDGWLNIRYRPGNDKAEGTAWVHECYLPQDQHAMRFEPWESLFLGDSISPLFFRTKVRHALRAGPGVEHERVRWVPADPDAYALEPLEVQGDWMRVRVKVPSDYCAGPDEVKAQVHEGWIKWRDAEIGPWVWYYTRGC